MDILDRKYFIWRIYKLDLQDRKIGNPYTESRSCIHLKARSSRRSWWPLDLVPASIISHFEKSDGACFHCGTISDCIFRFLCECLLVWNGNIKLFNVYVVYYQSPKIKGY